MKKRLFVKTFGCQMNVYDSGRMIDILASLGYGVTHEPTEADMVILNTCHIREKATEKVYSDLGRIREIKDERIAAGKEMIIAVAGCTAQAEGEEIIRRAPYVDMVFGPQSYHRIPKLLATLARNRDAGMSEPGRGVLDLDFPAESKFDSLPDITAQEGPAAFLAIQEGCDKFCHFCVVPYTRGAEYSRPAIDILRDARSLVAQGVREITLLGQNVSAWHGAAPSGSGCAEWGLGRLCSELAGIDGLWRIRYMTSHPRDIRDDLLEAHRDIPQLMPWLHLPVQSGSDKILKAMNRRHTANDYRRIIDRFRNICPDMAFSSDFIVGYPGETDVDYMDTVRLAEEIRYAQSYSFMYSMRPGTPASVMENQIEESVKAQRLAGLQEVLRATQEEFNSTRIGMTIPVLMERKGRHPGQLTGRSPWMQSVHVQAPERLIGTIVKVKIEESNLNSLKGKVSTGEYVSGSFGDEKPDCAVGL